MIHHIMPLLNTYHTYCGLKGKLPYNEVGKVDCPECLQKANKGVVAK